MTSNAENNTAIVLAPSWPSINGGYGIAIRASLLLYLECYSKIHFICVSDKPFEDFAAWPSNRIEWTHIAIINRPIWMRFLRSLAGSLPAITVRYSSVRREVMRAICRVIQVHPENTYLIFEDIPMACYLPDIEREYPKMPLALRSHDMLDKAYGPLSYFGSPIHRIAWKFETIRIRRFEKRVCKRVDKLWTISREDAIEYIKRLSVQPAGVIGVCMKVERYQDVAIGDMRTIVNVGTVDLRKGSSLENFIRHVWPKVRAQLPDARLVLAGRGTENFANNRMGIEGMGFVDDDRKVLGRGLIFVNPQTIGAGVQLKSIVAMLSGKALVSTEICTEGVEGKNGDHYIVADSDEEMASRIIGLMRDPELARRIGEQARKIAAYNYNTKRFIEDTKPLMEDFIGNTLTTTSR